MERDPQGGFTLIEALVALSVLAVSATFLLSATERHARDTNALSDRQIALWAAQNRLVALEAGLDDLPEVMALAHANWRVETAFTDTTDPDLLRADISVSPEGAPGAPLARLTGFVSRAEPG